MKLAIMQPYLFPYLGYFQLVHASDKFVFYDDVNFIKNGWINRNRFLLDGQARYFTVPLAGASPFVKIRDIRIQVDDIRWRCKLLETFRVAYKRAPFAAKGIELLERTLSLATDSIADVARHSVTSVMEYLGLRRAIVESSEVYANAHLGGQERLLDICRRESATLYVNAPGGRDLYDEPEFRAVGIDLRFLDGRLSDYRQSTEPFVPGLSILDPIVHCSRDEVAEMLGSYELAPAGHA
jgi:hypothetical protein